MQVINCNEDTSLVLDKDEEIEVNINNCFVTITDLSSYKRTINVNKGELDYCYIKKDKYDVSSEINLNEGKANYRVLDLLSNSNTSTYNINLNDSTSSAEFYLASISINKDVKNYKVNSFNNSGDTKVKIDCFGISENESETNYDVISFIKKGAKKSVVNQNSKILLFDKTSKGRNEPILQIEENDVKANHGSSLGMIDEEVLFYLTSRGITEEEARKLVSFGKVNYLIQEVRDEKLRDDLLNQLYSGR